MHVTHGWGMSGVRSHDSWLMAEIPELDGFMEGCILWHDLVYVTWLIRCDIGMWWVHRRMYIYMYWYVLRIWWVIIHDTACHAWMRHVRSHYLWLMTHGRDSRNGWIRGRMYNMCDMSSYMWHDWLCVTLESGGYIEGCIFIYIDTYCNVWMGPWSMDMYFNVWMGPCTYNMWVMSSYRAYHSLQSGGYIAGCIFMYVDMYCNVWMGPWKDV